MISVITEILKENKDSLIVDLNNNNSLIVDLDNNDALLVALHNQDRDSRIVDLHNTNDFLTHMQLIVPRLGFVGIVIPAEHYFQIRIS